PGGSQQRLRQLGEAAVPLVQGLPPDLVAPHAPPGPALSFVGLPRLRDLQPLRRRDTAPGAPEPDLLDARGAVVRRRSRLPRRPLAACDLLRRARLLDPRQLLPSLRLPPDGAGRAEALARAGGPTHAALLRHDVAGGLQGAAAARHHAVVLGEDHSRPHRASAGVSVALDRPLIVEPPWS